MLNSSEKVTHQSHIIQSNSEVLETFCELWKEQAQVRVLTVSLDNTQTKPIYLLPMLSFRLHLESPGSRDHLHSGNSLWMSTNKATEVTISGQCFSPSMLLSFWAGWLCGGGILCSIASLVAPLASTHSMPLLVTPQCDYQECLQMLPNILWVAKSRPSENHWVRGSQGVVEAQTIHRSCWDRVSSKVSWVLFCCS